MLPDKRSMKILSKYIFRPHRYQQHSSTSIMMQASSHPDMGESPPTRSITIRRDSIPDTNMSLHQDDAQSIDTTSQNPSRFVPYFSIRRFLRGPNNDSSSNGSVNVVNAVPPMSEPSTNDDYDDDNRSDVPSLSSLEAGDYYVEGETALDPAPETLVLQPSSSMILPMTITTNDNLQDEKARYLFHNNHNNITAYPTTFDPPITDSECDSNSSGSMTHDLPTLRRSSHATLDRSDILFPTVSKLRDQQSCTTYMFSLFVGCVALTVLIVFLLVMNLK